MPFRVLNSDNESELAGIDYPILLNKDQITSIKPINMMKDDDIISGFWIRLSNGKKYKATRVPQAIYDLFKTEEGLVPMMINGVNVEQNIQ